MNASSDSDAGEAKASAVEACTTTKAMTTARITVVIHEVASLNFGLDVA
jgi:hypothetical protein